MLYNFILPPRHVTSFDMLTLDIRMGREFDQKKETEKKNQNKLKKKHHQNPCTANFVRGVQSVIKCGF